MFLRRVEGKSMLPSLVPGDIIVASRRKKVQKGDIVIVKDNGREVIKRVRKITPTRVYIVGDNKKFSTDSRKYGWIKREFIVGIAVWAVNPSKITNRFSIVFHHRVLAVLAIMFVSLGVVLAVQKNPALSAALPNFIKPSTKVTAPQPAIAVEPVKPEFPVNKVVSDIPYCNGQALDIYYPRKVVTSTAPVVIYMHGGGWQINNKASEPNQLAVIDGLRDEGFAIVSIDYRKLPENFFPAPVSDALCSVRYLKATSKSLGIDKEKIGIYGFSAGGHLAAMVGVLDSQNVFNEGPYKEESSRVKAVVTLAGIFDFEQALTYGNELRIRYFLNGADRLIAHPINYVSKDDSPFLLVHGMQDDRVDPQQDIVLADALNKAGVKNEIFQVQNAEHGLGPVNGPVTPSNAEVNARIREFLKQNLLK